MGLRIFNTFFQWAGFPGGGAISKPISWPIASTHWFATANSAITASLSSNPTNFRIANVVWVNSGVNAAAVVEFTGVPTTSSAATPKAYYNSSPGGSVFSIGVAPS